MPVFHELSIRRATPQEGEKLTDLALLSKSYWNYPKDYLDQCRAALTVTKEDIENWPVFVADIEFHTAAFYALKKVSGEERLDHLWIKPDYIKKGLGKVLFRHAVIQAQELGWKSFRLAADPKAEGFYFKMGCTKIGTVQSKIKADLFLPHLEIKF